MSMFASLKYPNYRIYFISLVISSLGMWMSSTAKTWLVLVDLTKNDASAVGMLMGLMFLPSLLFMPLTASIADRFPKKRIMFWMNSISAVTAATLATLVVTGQIQLWHVFLLSFIDGTASAFASPAQQAFVSELVPAKNLTNAISLNSASFNGARLLGPGIGGILIALTSTGMVLAVTIVAFIPLLIALPLMKIDASLATPLQRGKGQFKEGLRYVKSRPDLMLLIGIAFMMGNFGFNFAVSNPIMATQAFGKGAGEFGLLGSLMGVGALSAALWSARRARPRLRHIVVLMAVFVVMAAVSALSPTYWFFALSMIPLGFSAVGVIITANALVQSNVIAEFRGRVMAVWMALLLGGTPLIAPIVGKLGAVAGPRATVWFECISIFVTLIVASWLMLRVNKLRVRIDRRRRPRYLVLERGQVTEGFIDAPLKAK